MKALRVLSAGPAVTVQDMGRPGYMAFGISPGGAADKLALIEGAALLGQSPQAAAIEMAAYGGEFEATADLRIALTGAPMRVTLDGRELRWNGSYQVRAGQLLSIGSTHRGVYGYLNLGGGATGGLFLNSSSTHLVGGIGRSLKAGDSIEVGKELSASDTENHLSVGERFDGGRVRVVSSLQTALFSRDEIVRFGATKFVRGPRGNRQGVELSMDGPGFQTSDQLRTLSEPMIAGDIQMTGDGKPFVLLPECQTTGGYPRIASVIPMDLPIVAQAALNSVLRFEFLDREQALACSQPLDRLLKDLRKRVRPYVRDPSIMGDLLAYELIDGVISADD